MKARVAVLFVLLVALGVILYQRFQRLKPLIAGNDQPVVAIALTPTPAPPVINSNRRLNDGSFNFNPPYHLPLDQTPSELMLDNWRERYEPLIKQTRTESLSAPSIFVYPVLDLTSEGIGATFTYGWRLAAQAALQHWTNARVIAYSVPENYGLPTLEDCLSGTKLTTVQWSERALNDPAAADADYVLTGWYEHSSESAEYRHQIVLLSKNKSLPEQPIVLVKEKRKKVPWLGRLATNQRDAMKSIASGLIDRKIAAPRPRADVQSIDLMKEMDQVSVMLDANDTWAVMEGIDRSLQLAALFPDETLPLQAAAFGLNALNYFNFVYATGVSFRHEYALRAYALAQLAMAIDPKPSLSHLNWLFALTSMDYNSGYYSDSFTGTDVTASQPELEFYRLACFNRHDVVPSAALTEITPHWLVLAQEDRKTWFIGNSEQRAYFDRSVPNWREHDFFYKCQSRAYSHDNYKPEDDSKHPWDVQWDRAKLALQSSLGNEIAALLVYANDSPKGPLFVERVSQHLGIQIDELKTLANSKDFYQIRQALYEPLGNLEVRDFPDPYHDLYTLLSLCSNSMNDFLNDPKRMEHVSGYAGFEWLPYERAQVYRKSDSRASHIIFNWYAYLYSVDEAAIAVGQNLKAVRSDHTQPYVDLIGFYRRNSSIPGANKRIEELEMALIRMDPFSPERYLSFASQSLLLNQYDIAASALETYRRVGVHEINRDMQIANLLAWLGCYEQCIDYYERYLKTAPKRYDVAISRALFQKYLGKISDAEVRKVFQKAIHELPGNDSFHSRYISYLKTYTDDYDEARRAVEYFEACCPKSKSYYNWVRLESAFGNKDKALEYLKLHVPESKTKTRIGLENAYASQADWARYLGDLKLCEEYIQKGAKYSAGTGSMMSAKASLAFEKKQYAEALHHVEESIDRYGLPSSGLFRLKAQSLYHLGRKEEALTFVDSETINKNPIDMDAGYLDDAMELYAMANEKERADKLWDVVLSMEGRNFHFIGNVLEQYYAINPVRAEMYCAFVDVKLSGLRKLLPE